MKISESRNLTCYPLLFKPSLFYLLSLPYRMNLTIWYLLHFYRSRYLYLSLSSKYSEKSSETTTILLSLLFIWSGKHLTDTNASKMLLTRWNFKKSPREGGKLLDNLLKGTLPIEKKVTFSVKTPFLRSIKKITSTLKDNLLTLILRTLLLTHLDNFKALKLIELFFKNHFFLTQTFLIFLI